MAFESNYITFIGNLTDDPDLRFTPSGAPVCSFRVASNRRWTGRDGQQQEETTFLNANCWRDMAENVAESLTKGDRVVVIGRLRVRNYENREGQTVWVTEIEADEVAPSLRWARTTISKTSGSGSGQSSQGATSGQGASGGQGGSAGSDGAPPPADDDVPF